jgi:hypothetical protein
VTPPQVILHERRLVHEVARRESLRSQPAADLDRGLDRGGARPADALLAGELPAGQAREPREAPVRCEKAARAVESALAAPARAEKKREELLGGERRGPGPGEALARALVGGKVSDAEGRIQL